MLIYKDKISGTIYTFIHIPKNSGKFIRNYIKSNKNNEILKDFWGHGDNMDLAHIPLLKCNKYIHNYNIDIYFSYSRNPYHRIISAYFYKNPNKTKKDFQFFCKNKLKNIDFNTDFIKENIHYYPQYLFLSDEENNIKNIKIHKLENKFKPTVYILKNFFDKECISIVNEVYKKDFELFGYSMIIFNLI